MLLATLTNSERRKVDILAAFIQLVSKKSKKIDLLELADQCQCTLKTIQRDIKQLNNHYQFMTLHEQSRFILPEQIHSPLTYPYYNTIYTSLSARLIETVFNHGALSLATCCDLLHTSKSSLLRLIKAMNPLLRDYFMIEIKTSTISYSGKESDIRNFIGNYYIEKQAFEPLPFSLELLNTRIHTALVHHLNPTNSAFIPIATYAKLNFVLLVINCHRIETGHYLSGNTTPSSINFSDDIILTIGSQLLNHTDSTFPIEELAYPYVGTELHSPISYDHLYTQLYEQMAQLCQDYPISNPHLTTYTQSITNVAWRLLSCESVSPVFYDYLRPLLQFFEDTFPHFLADMKQRMHVISPYLVDHPHAEQIIQGFLFHCLSQWPQLIPQLERYYSSFNLLLIPNTSYTNAENIRKKLLIELPFPVQISIYQGNYLKGDTKFIANFDLVINQLPNPELSFHPYQVNIQDTITADDCQTCIDLLKQLSKERL